MKDERPTHNMQPGELTIIIAAFNTNPEALKQSVSSATVLGCPVVICNDGSDDAETLKALATIAAWMGVEVFTHEENQGTAAALSTAAGYVNTPYLMKVDSDDRVFGLPTWQGDANPDAVLTKLDPSGKWGDWDSPSGLFEFIEKPGPVLNGLTLKTERARQVFRPLPMDAADDITLGFILFLSVLHNAWFCEANIAPVYHQRLDTGKKGDADWKVFPNARDRLHACAGQAFGLMGAAAPNRDLQANIFKAIREAHPEDYPGIYPNYPAYPAS